MTDEHLLELAAAAAGAAYAPYSSFHVGAAVLARDGRVITGTNVENASYGLTLCAERAALARAVAEGVRPGDVEAVAVTASPCGACRQWLLEFGVDRVVFRHEGGVAVRRTDELLPNSFSLWRGRAGEAAPGGARGGVVGDSSGEGGVVGDP